MYHLGDAVQMKKSHACGENKWEILWMGADIRIKRLECDHLIMIPRAEFNKKSRKVLHSVNDPVNLKEECCVPKENIAVPCFEQNQLRGEI